MFSGKEMEGRESGAEQIGANTEELTAVVSGGRRRETQVGDWRDASEKSSTPTSDG